MITCASNRVWTGPPRVVDDGSFVDLNKGYFGWADCSDSDDAGYGLNGPSGRSQCVSEVTCNHPPGASCGNTMRPPPAPGVAITAKMWGAGGASAHFHGHTGGAGGFTQGTFFAPCGSVFTVVVGQGGRGRKLNDLNNRITRYGGGGDLTGNNNIGGGGLAGVFVGNEPVNLNDANTRDRAVLVAGGGGGAGYKELSCAGGHGGSGGGVTARPGASTTPSTTLKGVSVRAPPWEGSGGGGYIGGGKSCNGGGGGTGWIGGTTAFPVTDGITETGDDYCDGDQSKQAKGCQQLPPRTDDPDAAKTSDGSIAGAGAIATGGTCNDTPGCTGKNAQVVFLVGGVVAQRFLYTGADQTFTADCPTPPSPPPAPLLPCPPSWSEFGEACYRMTATSGSFDEMRAACNSLSPFPSSLVSIQSNAENEFMYALAAAEGSGDYYMGGEKTASAVPRDTSSSSYRWVDGTPWSFTDFAPGEPNGGTGGGEQELVSRQPCVIFRLGGAKDKGWLDQGCQNTRRAVCKMPRVVAPPPPSPPEGARRAGAHPQRLPGRGAEEMSW